MQIKTAREILTRAKKDEIFDGDIPESDSDVLTKAAEIVELAEQAWSSHVRGPEVEAILNLAKADQNGASPESDEKAPESTPKTTSAFSGLAEGLSKSEPWEGYGEATVQEVTEGINWFGENAAEDVLDILKNVWAFESAHKNRSRILNFVKEAYVKFGGELGTEEPESEGAEADEEEGTEEEISTEEGGDEGVDESGVGGDDEEPEGVSEAEAEADEDKSDTGVDTGAETGAEGGEGEVRQAEPTGKDSGKRVEGSKGGESPEAKLVNLVVNELGRERMDGIPKKPEHEAPELPWNWNEVSDNTLHDLLMQYASLAYYKAYQRARDERIALHCKEAADELRNNLLIKAPKYDEKNKEIKVTVLEAQVNSDPNVRRWRKAQSKYERFAQQARLELESLHKVVEALSRLETMRHNSWERSRKS